MKARMNAACSIPATGDRAPERMFVAVRAIADGEARGRHPDELGVGTEQATAGAAFGAWRAHREREEDELYLAQKRQEDELYNAA